MMAENDPLLNAISGDPYRTIERNGNNAEGETETYISYVGKLSLNIILHTLILGFTVFIISLGFADPLRLFTFHPICMTTGFFFFTTNAIFTQSKYNIVSFRFHHQNRITLHWVLQGASVILMTIGFILVILTVNQQGAPHFFTNHSIVGLTAYILMCVSSLGGVATLYKHRFREWFTARAFKIAHSSFGIITYTMGTAALCLALFTHYFEKYNGSGSVGTCLIVILSVWAYAMFRPLSNLKSRLGF